METDAGDLAVKPPDIHIMTHHFRTDEDVEVENDKGEFVRARIKSENHSFDQFGYNVEYDDGNEKREKRYHVTRIKARQGSVSGPLPPSGASGRGAKVKVRRIGLDECCTPGLQYTYRTSLENLPFLQPEVHSEMAFLNPCRQDADNVQPTYSFPWDSALLDLEIILVKVSMPELDGYAKMDFQLLHTADRIPRQLKFDEHADQLPEVR